MAHSITMRRDPDLQKLLDRLRKQTARSRSDLVRDALRRHLNLLRFAEPGGYVTDTEHAAG